jgi:defect-in-organelle-trafficking protein DotB
MTTKNEDYFLPDEPTRFHDKDLEKLLTFCTQLDASDITLQTGQPVLAEIYGKIRRISKHKLSGTEVSEILNKIYGANGTTQVLSGIDVDTHYEFRPGRGERFRFRVNATGCEVEGHEGIQITLRTIPTDPVKIDSLGLPKGILEAYAPLQGIVYVTGATGSGKTTLLASLIRELAEQADGNRKILTYEAPIEFVYDAVQMPSSVVSQSEIPRHLPSFAAGVRNALRRKPHLILVGEARDPETISAAIDAALTGHPVYTTLHTNGVSETIRRLVTSFPADERHGRMIDIIETVRLIIWQQLVPGVDGKRVALREYLVFNENIRDQLLACNPDTVTATTRNLLKQYGQPMVVDAKAKFTQGLISERTYQVLSAGHRNADKDAGLVKSGD